LVLVLVVVLVVVLAFLAFLAFLACHPRRGPASAVVPEIGPGFSPDKKELPSTRKGKVS
jgi:hypothetical protein